MKKPSSQKQKTSKNNNLHKGSFNSYSKHSLSRNKCNVTRLRLASLTKFSSAVSCRWQLNTWIGVSSKHSISSTVLLNLHPSSSYSISKGSFESDPLTIFIPNSPKSIALEPNKCKIPSSNLLKTLLRVSKTNKI